MFYFLIGIFSFFKHNIIINKGLFMNRLMTYTLLIASLSCTSIYGGNWKFQIEPYMMATKIAGDASIGRISGAPVDVDFNTILDNLEMAAMLHFEAHHNSGWGVILDYGFMDLGQSHSTSRDGIAKVTLRQGVLESLALYRIKYGRNKVDYFAGVRWWDNDLSLTLDAAITPENSQFIKVKEDWLDLVMGVRWQQQLNRKLSVMARGDIGGLGMSSDFTSTLEAGVSYQLSKLMTLNVKYKGTWVDYDNEKNEGGIGHYQYDTVTHGPVIGLNFAF